MKDWVVYRFRVGDFSSPRSTRSSQRFLDSLNVLGGLFVEVRSKLRRREVFRLDSWSPGRHHRAGTYGFSLAS